MNAQTNAPSLLLILGGVYCVGGVFAEWSFVRRYVVIIQFDFRANGLLCWLVVRPGPPPSVCVCHMDDAGVRRCEHNDSLS